MAELFPVKRDIDPQNWAQHIRQNLVPEVQLETIRFHGTMVCPETQFPGLDYNNSSHRMRLSQFPFHERLFRAFIKLQVSESEIQRICTWERTRWAKEQHEAHNAIKIQDTTWDGIVDYRNTETVSSVSRQITRVPMQHRERQEVPAIPIVMAHELALPPNDIGPDALQPGYRAAGDESDDELHQSVGVELHQRLLVATEARARGENVILDPDWEQWLKEAAERGNLPALPHTLGGSPRTPMSVNRPQMPVYWGRETPPYLGDHPTAAMAAVRARLPPPPQYYPSVVPNPLNITAPRGSSSLAPTS